MLPLRFAAALCITSTLFGADVALLNLIDPAAKVVGGINVTRTVASPFGQLLLSKMNPNDAGFQDFINTVGFDPRRDVRDVVFGSPANIDVAATGAPKPKHEGIFAARGVFNGPQLLAAAKAKGGKNVTTVNYKGVDILKTADGALAVVDGSLLLIGQESFVRTAIDRRSVSAITPGPVFDKARSMMNKYDVWGVSAVPASSLAPAAPKPGSGPGPMPPVPLNALQSIQSASGGVIFDSMVTIEGEALTASEKDAQAMVDVFKFITGMMTMNRQNNPQIQQLEPLLNAIDVHAEGAAVKLAMRIPQADIEQFIKNAEQKKPIRRVSNTK